MIYLILANLYLAVFYGFYRLFLRKGTFFQCNRVYLLGATALAFILPLAEFSTIATSTVYQYQLPTVYLGGFQPTADELMGIPQAQPASIWSWLRLLYFAGCVLTAIAVLGSVFQTFRRLRRQVPGEAYSFFGFIRVDSTLRGRESILAHEQVHVRQGHTFDIAWVQVLKVFNWFNPVVYLYERSLRLQHEYIADGHIAGGNPLAYAQLLVARAMDTDSGLLKHTFSSKQTLKSRVAMLVSERSRKWSLVRYVLAIPIVGIMALYAAAHNHPAGFIANNLAVPDTTQTNTKAFLEAMGRNVEYRQEVLQEGGQGEVTALFRKTGKDQIGNIEFFNGVKFGTPLNDAIRKALTKPAIAALAPNGLNQLTIDFRVQGAPGKEPMPIEKPKTGTDLGKVTIIGYLPEKPESANKDTIDDDPDQVFQTTEIGPQPQGGMRTFMEWVGQNYDYPQEAIETGVNGKMLLSFIVEKDGSLSNIKIVEDLGYGTGDAAVRLLEKSPKWAPAVQNARAVRIVYTLPIRLNLQQ